MFAAKYGQLELASLLLEPKGLVLGLAMDHG